MKTEYTAMDLRPYGFDRPITAEGRKPGSGRTWDGKIYEINTSSILTRLIQEAGRYCERFASDLFIDWTAVEEMLTGDREIGTMFFGFRENGVDGESFLNNRLKEDKYHRQYRSIWRLDIEETDSGIDMSLYRVD